jgi:hypothetical protein
LPDLSNLNEALTELEKLGISTTQGIFVRMEDVKKLMAAQAAATQIEEKTEPKPKTMVQAKQQVLRDEKIMQNFPKPSPQAGRSISAQDSQPSSRT